MALSRLLLAGLLPAALAHSALLTPTSYSLQNGQGQASQGTFNYWDDTYTGSGSRTTDGAFLSGGLGQLTDGIIGCSNDWGADCGEGAAYRWLGWRTINPTMTFDFGSVQQFGSVAIHTNNSGQGGVTMWGSALIQFSDDGVTFGNDVTRTTTPAEQGNPSARYLDTPLNQSARYVRITLNDGPQEWIFVSEIQFSEIPEPGTLWLGGAGLILVLLWRRGAVRG